MCSHFNISDYIVARHLLYVLMILLVLLNSFWNYVLVLNITTLITCSLGNQNPSKRLIRLNNEDLWLLATNTWVSFMKLNSKCV